MKKIIYITFLLSTISVFSQLTIGKENPSNSSVSIEFGDYTIGEGRGIIVPLVTSAAPMPSINGTIVYDVSDKLMKYKKGDSWFNLSKNEITRINNQSFDTTGDVNITSEESQLIEKKEAKLGIGNPTPDGVAPGILVLEDSDKAMILPKVPNPHLNIINPEPGLMVYDTANKQLAIFNGKVWNFWK